MTRRDAESRLAGHLDSLIELLRQMAPRALQEFDEDAIHKSRVTTRRLKAAMELLEPATSSDHRRPIARVGRRLRRRLGPLRDIDVMLGHLSEIKPSARFYPAVEWFRQRLESQRDGLRRESSGKTSLARVLGRLETWPILRDEIARADPLIVESRLAESVHLQLDRFTEHANNLWHTDPHELRIAGKSLRYTLELARAQGHKLPAKVLRSFKRMQDNLGLWHDHVVLAERAMRMCIDCDLPLHDPAMQRQVLGLIDDSMKRAQQQLVRFGKLWTELGPELSLGIRGGIPLTTSAAAVEPSAVPESIESKMDPDPAETPPPPAPAPAGEAAPPAA